MDSQKQGGRTRGDNLRWRRRWVLRNAARTTGRRKRASITRIGFGRRVGRRQHLAASAEQIKKREIPPLYSDYRAPITVSY